VYKTFRPFDVEPANVTQ